jgi:mannan endo-1,6-alpha-mannosidase
LVLWTKLSHQLLQFRGTDLWPCRLDGLVNRTIDIFFPNGILVEVPCELSDQIQCNTDRRSFNGDRHR